MIDAAEISEGDSGEGEPLISQRNCRPRRIYNSGSDRKNSEEHDEYNGYGKGGPSFP